MEKKLFRNEHDKMIAGVASGLAEYMQVEVTIVRLLFALSTIFMAGGGLIVYIVMWIIVPVNNDPLARYSKFNDYFNKNNPQTPPVKDKGDITDAQVIEEDKTNNPNWTSPKGERSSTGYQNPFWNDVKPVSKPNDTGRIVGGLFLLVFGCYFLLNEFNIIPFWFRIGKLWPLIFVAIGLSIILKSNKRNEWERWKNMQNMAPADEPKADTAKEEKENNDASTNTQ